MSSLRPERRRRRRHHPPETYWDNLSNNSIIVLLLWIQLLLTTTTTTTRKATFVVSSFSTTILPPSPSLHRGHTFTRTTTTRGGPRGQHRQQGRCDHPFATSRGRRRRIGGGGGTSGLFSRSSSSSNNDDDDDEGIGNENILRTLTLVDVANTDKVLAGGYELLGPTTAAAHDDEEEDEVEMFYPTARQYFRFFPEADDPPPDDDLTTVQVRTTSFGCGKLGHQVWPSSLVLCLLLVEEFADTKNPKPRTVLELGAGCGLPSVVCRDVLQIPRVIATDFWYDSLDAEFDKDRLIPEIYHGQNLRYNVLPKKDDDTTTTISKTRVANVDWHNLDTIRDAIQQSMEEEDGDDNDRNDTVVIGSDLMYYPMDVQPLWETMEVLLKEIEVTRIVLVSPLKPETREALPAFLELLETKAASPDGCYRYERQELVLQKTNQQDYLEVLDRNNDDDELDGDRFIKMTLSLIP